MVKEISFTEIAINKLSNSDLVSWATFMTYGITSAGTGWLARKELIRMANEIVRLRQELQQKG